MKTGFILPGNVGGKLPLRLISNGQNVVMHDLVPALVAQKVAVGAALCTRAKAG